MPSAAPPPPHPPITSSWPTRLRSLDLDAVAMERNTLLAKHCLTQWLFICCNIITLWFELNTEVTATPYEVLIAGLLGFFVTILIHVPPWTPGLCRFGSHLHGVPCNHLHLIILVVQCCAPSPFVQLMRNHHCFKIRISYRAWKRRNTSTYPAGSATKSTSNHPSTVTKYLHTTCIMGC